MLRLVAPRSLLPRCSRPAGPMARPGAAPVPLASPLTRCALSPAPHVRAEAVRSSAGLREGFREETGLSSSPHPSLLEDFLSTMALKRPISRGVFWGAPNSHCPSALSRSPPPSSPGNCSSFPSIMQKGLSPSVKPISHPGCEQGLWQQEVWCGQETGRGQGVGPVWRVGGGGRPDRGPQRATS